MAIKQLVESGQTVEVQRTTFSLDVVGRYFCSTLPEAVNNGGLAFDVVVLGAGMFGAYCTEKIYRRGAANKRVLILRREALTRVARPLTLTDFRFAPIVALDKYRQTRSFDMVSTVDNATEAAPVLPVPKLS